MSQILIVDDEPSICWAFEQFLGDEGHNVRVAATAEEGLRLAEQSRPDAMVLDVRLPGMDGLTALKEYRRRFGPIPIVVITAFGNLETAVRAMEEGAFDYLVKPFDLDQAAAVIGRAVASPASSAATTGDSSPVNRETIVGRSPAMQELFKTIAVVAPTEVPVFITGESGTGKELVAQAIHRHSRRRSGPFLPVCLAALSPGLVERELFGHARGSFTGADRDQKGLLELANGGTVLLDEVGDIPLGLQVKILRAIEYQEVIPVGEARPRSIDVRFLAATNRPLGDLIASGQFREDLFFRLSVFPVRVPPLRDRRDDITLLAEHFLKQANRAVSADAAPLSDEVRQELTGRRWVGNVRELRNTIQHAAIVARGQVICLEHLPPPARPSDVASRSGSPQIDRLIYSWTESQLQAEDASDAPGESLFDQFLALVEAPFLRTVLEASEGNKAAAAQRIGIHRATLRQKLRRYGID
jgi:two-component system nitrogen regulation response regulator GlnG